MSIIGNGKLNFFKFFIFIYFLKSSLQKGISQIIFKIISSKKDNFSFFFFLIVFSRDKFSLFFSLKKIIFSNYDFSIFFFSKLYLQKIISHKILKIVKKFPPPWYPTKTRVDLKFKNYFLK